MTKNKISTAMETQFEIIGNERYKKYSEILFIPHPTLTVKFNVKSKHVIFLILTSNRLTNWYHGHDKI
jgi:hypothetical protein